MARQLSAKKPKDLRYTLGTLFSYMGRHKFLLLAVAVLVSVSALANLLGTYMIRRWSTASPTAALTRWWRASR